MTPSQKPHPFLVRIMPDQIDSWTDKIYPHFEKISKNSNGKCLPEDILLGIQCAKMECWIILEEKTILSVFLTRMVLYPRRKICEYLACVGERWKDWMYLLKEIDVWAKDQGCDGMEALAPQKWRPVFPEYGVSHVIFEKDL
jgi:hypothetical protein